MEIINPSLNAHEAPPLGLKEIFQSYKKVKISEINVDPQILDFTRIQLPDSVELLGHVKSSHLEHVFQRFLHEHCENSLTLENQAIYGHKALPGLLILPSLLPPQVQKGLLSRMVHRDLSDPNHKTNLHKHYQIPYPLPEQDSHVRQSGSSTLDERASFFSYPVSSGVAFVPKDPESHRPLSIARVMQKGLRWITLGGQYDWTNKVYPEEVPPPFPADIADLLECLFPEMKAEAAIVNFYSPGDTLSLHRDVSEKSDKGLVSISIGCDCIFIIGLGDPTKAVVLRLRSGDGLLMAKEARFAWHGVPRILADTCPQGLRAWPAEAGYYQDWQGWMGNKRINLNVRQMHG